jgi:hypothetical protein
VEMPLYVLTIGQKNTLLEISWKRTSSISGKGCDLTLPERSLALAIERFHLVQLVMPLEILSVQKVLKSGVRLFLTKIFEIPERIFRQRSANATA